MTKTKMAALGCNPNAAREIPDVTAKLGRKNPRCKSTGARFRFHVGDVPCSGRPGFIRIAQVTNAGGSWVSVRRWVPDDGGTLRATRLGLGIKPDELPGVLRALHEIEMSR